MNSREQMQANFVANKGERPAKRARKPRKSLPHASEKQQVLDKTWSLIRGSMLIGQLRDGQGYHCHECGIVVEHTYELDLDHIVPRSKGGKYTPANAILLCNYRSPNGSRSCHSSKHGEPQWSTP